MISVQEDPRNNTLIECGLLRQFLCFLYDVNGAKLSCCKVLLVRVIKSLICASTNEDVIKDRICFTSLPVGGQLAETRNEMSTINTDNVNKTSQQIMYT